MTRTAIEIKADADADSDQRRRAAAIEQMRQMVAEGKVDLDLIAMGRPARRID